MKLQNYHFNLDEMCHGCIAEIVEFWRLCYCTLYGCSCELYCKSQKAELEEVSSKRTPEAGTAKIRFLNVEFKRDIYELEVLNNMACDVSPAIEENVDVDKLKIESKEKDSMVEELDKDCKLLKSELDQEKRLSTILQGQKEQLQEENEGLQALIKKEKSRIKRRLSLQIDEIRDNFQSSETVNKILNKRLNEIKSREELLKEKIDSQNADIWDLQNQLVMKNETVKLLQMKVNELQNLLLSENASPNVLQEEKYTLEITIDELRSKRAEDRKKIKALHEDLEYYEKKFDTERDHKNALREDLQIKKDEVITLRDTIRTLERQIGVAPYRRRNSNTASITRPANIEGEPSASRSIQSQAVYVPSESPVGSHSDGLNLD